MIELYLLTPGVHFTYNKKAYTVLQRSVGMSEVVDDTGKLWAWPSMAKVKTAWQPKRAL